jgi:riboflavin kinase/FMN adenylyltransferase
VTYESKIFKGMLYIGPRPTVNGIQRVIEVNIFDFDKDIYGDRLTINFHQLIRGDKKFENLDLLKRQLHRDKEDALKILETITFVKP